MSTFDLCNTREKRFLNDLIEADAHDRRNHPVPELHAITRAVERMWGGHHEKQPPIATRLLYYFAVYESHAPRTIEDVEEWREGVDHEVYRILQGFMESVTLAIKDGSSITHEDGGPCIDLFRIPQWFYDEVMRDVQLTDAGRYV